MTNVRVTVVFDLPELSAEEWERRRELFERVGWPMFVERLIMAVEARGRATVTPGSVDSTESRTLPAQIEAAAMLPQLK